MTSSPLYPQSNEFIEKSVQIVKNLLQKAEASGQDPYLRILAYRTTPVHNNLSSPAQLFNHREHRIERLCNGRVQRFQALEGHQDNCNSSTDRTEENSKQYDSRSPSELTTVTGARPTSNRISTTNQDSDSS